MCRSEELVRIIRTELDYEGPIAGTPFLLEYGVESYLTITIALVIRIHLGINHGGVCELEEPNKVKKTCLRNFNNLPERHIVWITFAKPAPNALRKTVFN
jgi:hypothetical protein